MEKPTYVKELKQRREEEEKELKDGGDLAHIKSTKNGTAQTDDIKTEASELSRETQDSFKIN